MSCSRMGRRVRTEMVHRETNFGPRECPVCGTSSGNAELFLAENVDRARISSLSYASRKAPEFMNLNLVRCPVCDLVYADDPPSRGDLASAYHSADYDSVDEAEDAARSYLDAIAPLLASLQSRADALEIGTGTGAFLALLESEGFTGLVGVEPSVAAINAAPARRREWIRVGIFEGDHFEPESFDLVCCFMTMEHVIDPRELARAVFRLLRPGGAFVTVTHDYRSGVNRVLGRRSPIIDIEHMQLFSSRSIEELFARSGYSEIHTTSFRNSYALRYWWQLIPAPSPISRVGSGLLRISRLDRVKFTFNVGNQVCWGRKPVEVSEVD